MAPGPRTLSSCRTLLCCKSSSPPTGVSAVVVLTIPSPQLPARDITPGTELRRRLLVESLPDAVQGGPQPCRHRG